jgi:hypothetical protein
MPLTLDDCRRENLHAQGGNRRVIYHAAPVGTLGEVGIITSVNSTYVFVRFGTDQYSKACRPQDLEWETS